MPLTVSELDDKHLEMIEEMAGTGFSPSEIAEVLEVDEKAFEKAFSDRSSSVYRRYRKGHLLAQLLLRKRIFKDAGHESSPAQTLAKKIMDDAAYKLNQYE